MPHPLPYVAADRLRQRTFRAPPSKRARVRSAVLSAVAAIGLAASLTAPGAASAATTPDFASWAAIPGVQAVSGDFDRNGLGDIALVGGPGWNTVPIAFRNSDGTFRVTNEPVPEIPTRAQASGAKAVAGDFNRDGFSDIALVGGANWTTIPIGLSDGYGSFNARTRTVSSFPAWAQVGGARPVAGDFNGDGFSDIALVGAPGWTRIPVALSLGDGYFNAY
jgi:hypothetical protein